MSWITPILSRAEQYRAKRNRDRHGAEWWREYHKRRNAVRKPYLTMKAREYRLRREALASREETKAEVK